MKLNRLSVGYERYLKSDRVVHTGKKKNQIVIVNSMANGKKEESYIEKCDLIKDNSKNTKMPAFNKKSPFNFPEKSTNREKYLR